MNPNKFHHRIKLFNDILYEILKTESNYRAQLNALNLKLITKIEEHNNTIYLENLDISKQSFKNRKTTKITDKNKNIKRTLITSKSNDNLLQHKEGNQMIDKLVSESLQHLISFYKLKHNFISKEISDLEVIVYKFSTSNKKYDKYEDLDILENNKEEFDKNYIKLMKVKKMYFERMNNLELILQEEEKKKKVKDPKNQNQNKLEDNINEKENIDELIELKKKYKKYLTELTRSQKEYIANINEIGNEIQEFNIIENNILYDTFKIFEQTIINLLKEINNYCLIYENNKKLIEDLNMELGNNLIFDDRIYANYLFEDYIPKSIDINNQNDFSVIQKISKLIGFEFDKIKTNYSDDDNILLDNKISYKEIDDNFLFLLLMSKFIGGEYLLNEKEKNLMKNLLNQKKYIREFLSKLNKIRINKQLFSTKESFSILLEFFNEIFTKISLMNDDYHEIVKFLMILSETFHYIEDDKKVFLNNVINIPEQLKDSKFWIKYIDLEIKFEEKKYAEKLNSRYEYIVFLSNTTHLKEYLVEKEKAEEIIEYFRDKYKFSDEEVNIIKEQVKII